MARIAREGSTSQVGQRFLSLLRARIVVDYTARVHGVRIHSYRTHRFCVQSHTFCQKHAVDCSDGSVRSSHEFLPRDNCTPTFVDLKTYEMHLLYTLYYFEYFGESRESSLFFLLSFSITLMSYSNWLWFTIIRKCLKNERLTINTYIYICKIFNTKTFCFRFDIKRIINYCYIFIYFYLYFNTCA